MFKRFIAVMVVGIVAGLSLLAPAASAHPRHDNHDGRFIIICFVDRNHDRFDSNSFDNGFNGFGGNSFDNGFNGFNGFGSDRFVRDFHHGDLVCFVVRRDHHNDDRDF